MSDHQTVTSAGSARRRAGDSVMRAAPVAPLHDDGVRVFTIGTITFIGASLALVLGRSAWQPAEWWLPTALSGAAIGVIGIGYCVWRRNKRTREAALGIAPPTA